MSVDQLFWLRPVLTQACWFPQTPMDGLFLCGSGSHPGGGVMGAPGYIAAKTLIDSKI
jgi:phytoene dehydrogenase-like protein